MSLEVWTAAASVGTFIVIAVTAIVAFVQLRHLRASNQIAAVTTLQGTVQGEEFLAARRFVREELADRLRDASFRRELDRLPVGDAARPLLVIGNFYEELGTFAKRGIVDSAMACDMWSSMVIGDWLQMAPAIAIIRRKHGLAMWENFESMAELAQRWVARYPKGTYPKNRKRLPLEDVWVAEDQREQAAR